MAGRIPSSEGELDFVRPVYDWRRMSFAAGRVYRAGREKGAPQRNAAADQRRHACLGRLAELNRAIAEILARIAGEIGECGPRGQLSDFAENTRGLVRTLGAYEIERAEVSAEIMALSQMAIEEPARG